MDRIKMDATALNSSGALLKKAPATDADNYHLPAEIMRNILMFLPQKDLVSCREVCRYWRDVIDLHCPMKDVISLAEDDIFLDRKLQLRITSCQLGSFSQDSPNVLLSYPQAIKSFHFSNLHGIDDYEVNFESARGLLRQIKPYVQDLVIGYNHSFLCKDTPPYIFPNVRKLFIQCRDTSHSMHDEVLVPHGFPSLEELYFTVRYKSEKLMDVGCGRMFNFVAKHAQTLKLLHASVCLFGQEDSPIASEEFILSKNVKLLLGRLQLDHLFLTVPLKYVPAWAQIIATQKKLISLNCGSSFALSGPGGFPFYTIVPGIQSNISTLRCFIHQNVSSVEYDGISWIPLDLSVFRDAVNLSYLWLERNTLLMDHDRTPRPDEGEGAEIINLDKINSNSLRSLKISDFVCNSGELQTLIKKAPILDTLTLRGVRAPPTSHRFTTTGVHGGIIQSFLEKEDKRMIEVVGSLNISDEAQNEKLEAVRVLYPEGFKLDDSFIHSFY